MAEVFDTRAKRRQLARQAKPAVRVAASGVAARARTNLAGHRETGAAIISVEHDPINSYVTLDDPASLSIEFGRGAYTTKTGARVGSMEGLHVLGRAVSG